MKHFMKIDHGIDVTALALCLQRQPELWNVHNDRREFKDSAHMCTSDIWIRFNDPKYQDDYDKFTAEHDAIWYDSYKKLPQLRPIIFHLMARCQAVRLGGVLITRIPPGGHVLPHTDRGWHPEYYNMKIYVPIQSNDQCVNRVEDECVVMNQGDAWFFDNTKEHEVLNSGTTERITLIVCMRSDE